MNAVREITSVDQVIALAIRVYKFLRKLIGNFDGVTVQEAILHRKHPFWTKLEEAAKELELPFNFIELECVFSITGKKNESCLELISRCHPAWQARMDPHVIGICETCTDDMDVAIDYDIVLLYPTQDVPYRQILEEFKKRGWENTSPKDGLRVLADFPCAATMASTGKYKHYIEFINDKRPEESLEIGYDAMGSHFFHVVGRPRGCYAARRKRV